MLVKKYIIFDKFKKRKLSKLKFQDRQANNKVIERLKKVLKEVHISTSYRVRGTRETWEEKQEFSRLTDIAKNIQAEEIKIRY